MDQTVNKLHQGQCTETLLLFTVPVYSGVGAVVRPRPHQPPVQNSEGQLSNSVFLAWLQGCTQNRGVFPWQRAKHHGRKVAKQRPVYHPSKQDSYTINPTHFSVSEASHHCIQTHFWSLGRQISISADLLFNITNILQYFPQTC